jgi:hypothetical protein
MRYELLVEGYMSLAVQSFQRSGPCQVFEQGEFAIHLHTDFQSLIPGVKTCSWVDQHLTQLRAIPSRNDQSRHWKSTGTTFFQARSGVAASSKTSGAGARKPDITLVTDRTSNSHDWSDVISIIDVKYRHTTGLIKNSMAYMIEVSRLVFTNQVHRRFFVGALLSGPEMRIAIFTRGCGAFSEPVNIYGDPVKYMQLLSWFTHAEPPYLGYDTCYTAPTSTNNLLLRLTKENSTAEEDMVRTSVLSIIYNSTGGFGRTTRVMAVRCLPQPGVDEETLIVKEVWQSERGLSDGMIHRFLEDKERLQIVRMKLGVFLNYLCLIGLHLSLI